jgi:hypothetical protein
MGDCVALIRAPGEVDFLCCTLPFPCSTQDPRSGGSRASGQRGTRRAAADTSCVAALLLLLLLLLLLRLTGDGPCCKLEDGRLLGALVDGGFGEALVCGSR